MVMMTLELPEELAERVRPMQPWLPTILELGLVGFETGAVATASEVVRFLSRNPTTSEVLDYHVSKFAQARLQRLLALNVAGAASDAEQRELDELEQVEHIVLLLKARIAHGVGRAA